jgi:hypothetical protein
MTTAVSTDPIIAQIDALLGNPQTPNTLTFQLYSLHDDPNQINAFLQGPQGQQFLKNMMQLDSDLQELQSDNPAYRILCNDLENPIFAPGLPPMSLIASIENEDSYHIAMRLYSLNTMIFANDMVNFENQFPPTAK